MKSRSKASDVVYRKHPVLLLHPASRVTCAGTVLLGNTGYWLDGEALFL